MSNCWCRVLQLWVTIRRIVNATKCMKCRVKKCVKLCRSWTLLFLIFISTHACEKEEEGSRDRWMVREKTKAGKLQLSDCFAGEALVQYWVKAVNLRWCCCSPNICVKFNGRRNCLPIIPMPFMCVSCSCVNTRQAQLWAMCLCRVQEITLSKRRFVERKVGGTCRRCRFRHAQRLGNASHVW